ncbi:hypothetical protein [Bacillus sp. NPDC077027]|uniref:hypothetical protein n=1 Tax=Bacillus sp. NPDC077027 TaxID=3390548 RepID=UPI003D015044
MDKIKYVVYFILSFMLQFIWYAWIKKKTDVTMIDMLAFSTLFALFMYLLDRMLSKKKVAQE